MDENGVRSEWPRVDDATGQVTFRTTRKGTLTWVYLVGTFNGW